MSNYFQNIISEKDFFEAGPEVEDYQELVTDLSQAKFYVKTKKSIKSGIKLLA